ncbi:golgin subfamily A member 6-like protein 6 [Solenopsis invicta]|uniref:golgin subfamily A member 6-like protein 6 n=1 Tax=Solenopsis invicta TaxID=13686 RepID=UPI000E33E80B|nr:golgin subfamily A member 6-like protein 6 [Solenopsis invicta]
MERMMEQLDQIRKEWEEEKQTREEERRKEKGKEEKKNLERRIENLEWEKEKKDREKRKNNIIMRGVNKWEEDKIEQETKEFIKENLKIEVDIIKAYKVQSRGDKCTVVAEVGSKREVWGAKERDNGQKERTKSRSLYRRRSNEDGKRNAEQTEGESERREKRNKVKVGYGKIMIEDKWYRWNTREKKLKEEKRRGGEE